LIFLKDTSYCKEQPKIQEDVARRKELKEEEAGSGNSNTDTVNSGSGFSIAKNSQRCKKMVQGGRKCRKKR
jgi:hypothetical protein